MNREDYFKYYIQGSDHYLIPKDVFKELFNEMINWKEESKQLKDNWNKLKEWASNFYNSEEVGWAGCGMRYTLEKMQEIEGSDK